MRKFFTNILLLISYIIICSYCGTWELEGFHLYLPSLLSTYDSSPGGGRGFSYWCMARVGSISGGSWRRFLGMVFVVLAFVGRGWLWLFVLAGDGVLEK